MERVIYWLFVLAVAVTIFLDGFGIVTIFPTAKHYNYSKFDIISIKVMTIALIICLLGAARYYAKKLNGC